jgi:hypothetical protein
MAMLAVWFAETVRSGFGVPVVRASGVGVLAAGVPDGLVDTADSAVVGVVPAAGVTPVAGVMREDVTGVAVRRGKLATEVRAAASRPGTGVAVGGLVGPPQPATITAPAAMKRAGLRKAGIAGQRFGK